MTAVSDFAAKQTAHNTRIATAIDDLAQDVANLNDQIAKLQGTPGVLTPEDQALLDGIEKSSDALATKLEGVAAITPPAVPPA